MARVVPGSRVCVDVSRDSDILQYMGLADTNHSEGIRMYGEVTYSAGINWKVYLTATEKEHYFGKLGGCVQVAAPDDQLLPTFVLLTVNCNKLMISCCLKVACQMGITGQHKQQRRIAFPSDLR